MGKNVMLTALKQIDFEEYEDKPLAAKEVRIQTLYSGISAGTELTAYRGSNPYLHKRWDAETHLFLTEKGASVSYPMGAWGYEESGKVSEVGSHVTKVKIGDLVYGAWGHRTVTIISEDSAAEQLLPASLDPILGIFSRIGATCLNGVHDAAIRIGETVAVFGLGTVGQMVAQLAKRSGSRVIGVEPNPMRLEMAIKLGGVDIGLDPRQVKVAEQIKSLTENRGADVCIESSGFYPALHEAIRSAAYSAKVVALGFFQGQGEGLYLGDEFHHNRINLVCSQIYGVNPELTYRWNDKREAATVMQLQADSTINLRPIITHVIPFSEAAEAFRMCDCESEKTIQVVLDFTQ
jgi:2-desacetyl-2-hydroxyethyl bacteriochlorophyllide A dehydrogenase